VQGARQPGPLHASLPRHSLYRRHGEPPRLGVAGIARACCPLGQRTSDTAPALHRAVRVGLSSCAVVYCRPTRAVDYGSTTPRALQRPASRQNALATCCSPRRAPTPHVRSARHDTPSPPLSRLGALPATDQRLHRAPHRPRAACHRSALASRTPPPTRRQSLPKLRSQDGQHLLRLRADRRGGGCVPVRAALALRGPGLLHRVLPSRCETSPRLCTSRGAGVAHSNLPNLPNPTLLSRARPS